MLDTVLILDTCFLGLAKAEKFFNNKKQLVEFLQPWPNLEEFIDNIYICFQRLTCYRINILIKSKRHEILKAVEVSKKAKIINNLAIISAGKITAIRN